MPRLHQMMEDDKFSSEHRGIAFFGTITATAPTEGSDVFVDIPSLGITEGPCKWEPRPTDGGVILPQAGDEALLIFDDRNQAWILQFDPS